MRARLGPRAWPLLVFAGACHRDPATASLDGADALASAAPSIAAASSDEIGVPTTASPPSASPLPPEFPASAPAPSGEAKRTTLAAFDRNPLLRAQSGRLRDHFGVDARGPFLLQTVERAGGGYGLLVARADEADPIVLALDRDRVAFVRDRPTVGITPPVLHATLAPGPERGLAMFSFVPDGKLVAARMWADDGNPYAEIVVMTTDRCDFLSVAYAARLGWIVACSSAVGTRAQRLREDLTGAWGTEGAVVGTIGPVDRPVITIDEPSAWTLTQRAKAVGGDRTLTFRYDRDAQPMPSSSTSKTKVEFGGMTGGKPRDP